ncbi:ComF family protein [Paenibacillus sp. GCM10028914]|uniref:ComF family protein n=1 Tax=Paenibacillus sp. GCM10028914 TaxID=3273416 RepID=UPI0036D2BDBE
MLMDTLDRILKPFHRLLASSGQKCLTCGRITSLSREYLGICRTCYMSIPWITRPRCIYCGRQIGCPDCTREQAGPWHFVCNRSAATYNADMREWLAQYKYRGNEAYAPLLISMLERAYRQLQQEIAKKQQISFHKTGQAAEVQWQAHMITSVPVSLERLKERGFNQAEVLARGLAAAVKLPYAELLQRDRHTHKQSFKSRMDRLKDMEGVFRSLPEAAEVIELLATSIYSRTKALKSINSAMADAPFSLRILLIDDIYTTGSTINACSQELKIAGETQGIPVEIFSLTWARS